MSTSNSPGSTTNRDLVLRVASVRRATPLTRYVRVDLGAAKFRFVPGQAVMIGEASSTQRVPYSIASSPEEAAANRQLEFLIKIEPSGRWGHLFDSLKRGQRVGLRGPFGSFAYPSRAGQRTLLFIAGGTGISPIRSMITHAIATGHPGPLRLLFSARTPQDFAYLPELRRLVRKGRLALQLHVTREASTGWRGERGRIELAHLAPLVDPGRTLGLVCGPAAMVAEVPLMLQRLGVAPRDIELEKWSS